MNLPVDNAIEKGVRLKDFNYKNKFLDFLDKGFTGYVVVTIDGFEGIEEGVLIFKKGTIVAAIYDFLNYDSSLYGKDALNYVFNAFVCDEGVVDVYTLTPQQVDLITAFNDKIELEKKISKGDISKLFSSKYSEDLSKSFVSKFLKEHSSREEVLKKLGLEGLG
ncbi:MAG: DUF2226 domain-containing protein [Candidatus Diapherotrites archaeon]|nr:DUF2226 domain-containing protein [Candidatus Diapherotrites archaeon]